MNDDVLTITPEHVWSHQGGAAPGSCVSLPISLPAEQTYFWTYRWQEAEAEALAEIKRGDYLLFDSDDPQDVARWLLSDNGA